MDRFSLDDPKKQLIYKNALEFIGAVRAGISWERFCIYAVRFSEAFIDMLNGTEDVRRFLSSRGITMEYAQKNARAVLARLHSNRDNDHYLTLALPRSASDAQIRKRWKELMLIYHPDRNSSADAASCARRINEAYSILKSPGKKMEYDRNTAKIVESYFTSRRSKTLHSNESGERPFISPEFRRMVPKIIIASSTVVSCIVLLIIFFKNKPEVYTNPPSVLPQENRQYNGEDHRMPDPGKEDSAKKEENTIAGFQSADVQGKDRPAIAPPEKSRKGIDTVAANVEALYPYGPRSRPADATIKSTLPSQATQERSLHDTKAEIAKRISTEHIEVSPLSTARQMESPEQTTKKDIPLPSPQKLPSPEQKGIPGETAPLVPSMPLSGETRPDLETEVFLFFAQYIVAYEEGDIGRFMDFFSKSAVENNKLRYADIKRFYAKNFEAGRYSYTLRNIRVMKGEEPVVVSGDYSISKVADADKVIKTDGTIRWTLGKENGSFKIMRIDYDTK